MLSTCFLTAASLLCLSCHCLWQSSMPHDSFHGLVAQEKKHTLRSFSAYADWAKEIHFSGRQLGRRQARQVGC